MDGCLFFHLVVQNEQFLQMLAKLLDGMSSAADVLNPTKRFDFPGKTEWFRGVWDVPSRFLFMAENGFMPTMLWSNEAVFGGAQAITWFAYPTATPLVFSF